MRSCRQHHDGEYKCEYFTMGNKARVDTVRSCRQHHDGEYKCEYFTMGNKRGRGYSVVRAPDS